MWYEYDDVCISYVRPEQVSVSENMKLILLLIVTCCHHVLEAATIRAEDDNQDRSLSLHTSIGKR